VQEINRRSGQNFCIQQMKICDGTGDDRLCALCKDSKHPYKSFCLSFCKKQAGFRATPDYYYQNFAKTVFRLRVYEQPVIKQKLQVFRGTLSRTLQRTVVL
jgi:hypothetical protein